MKQLKNDKRPKNIYSRKGVIVKAHSINTVYTYMETTLADGFPSNERMQTERRKQNTHIHAHTEDRYLNDKTWGGSTIFKLKV